MTRRRKTPAEPTLPVSLIADGWSRDGRLGNGGQGIVLRLVRAATGQRAALKFPTPRASHTDLARLRREIRTLAAIDHPHVMPLLSYDADAAQPWMLMPLGTPLGKHWEAIRGTIPNHDLFDAAVDIIKALAAGLKAFHDRAETHRDLKPANVIVVNSTVRISDAGILFPRSVPRLTPLTTRPVRRAFYAASLGAHDPTIEAPLWEDCLHVSWLFAWMLADRRDTPFGNYHWRYASMIDDPRCETVVRPLMAACSHERIAPENAAALETLLHHLLPPPSRDAAVAGSILSSIEAATQVQNAREITDRANRLELAEIAAVMSMPHIQPIRDQLHSLLLPLVARDPGFSAEGEPATPLTEYTHALVADPKASPVVFEYLFGPARGDKLSLKMRCVSPHGIHDSRLPEDYLPAVFDCHITHPDRTLCRSLALVVRRDGSLWRAAWHSLHVIEPTTSKWVIDWFIQAASDPALRPVR